MAGEKLNFKDKVNNWIKNPKAYLLVGLVLIIIVALTMAFKGRSEKYYLDDHGWQVEINEGNEKSVVNVFFKGNKAYGFVKGKTVLSKDKASRLTYDPKYHTFNVYGSESALKFHVAKKNKDQVEGTVMSSHSSAEYSYKMIRDDTISLQ